MFLKLQQVLKYGFLYILLFASTTIKSCPMVLKEGWKQLSVVERARRANVVAVGKSVTILTDNSRNRTWKIGGFYFLDVLKGKQITEKIYKKYNDSVFYVLGFGSSARCLADIEKYKTYLLFLTFVPETTSLVAKYETAFSATAEATIENQDKILASLGWGPWSDWSSCSASCSGGWDRRTRTCRKRRCEGSKILRRACNNYECDGATNVLEHFIERRKTRSIPTPPMHEDALKINSLRNLSVPTHQIFWEPFPRHFTMFAAAKYVNYTGGYMISFIDASDRLQIGIKVSRTSVALEYSQAGRNNQFIAFNVEVVDRKWHRFAFSVGEGLVSFYLDCEMIGTREIAQNGLSRVDRSGNVYLNAKPEPPQRREENIEFYIEELTLFNASAGQQQCKDDNIFTSTAQEPFSEGSGAGPPELEYTWTTWTACSKTCGTDGVRRRIKMCSRKSREERPEECQQILQLSEEQSCNNIPCPGKCRQRCINGICAAKNKCKCKKNYYGPNCRYKRASLCKPACSNGAECSKGICKCRQGFFGKSCEKAKCSPMCQQGGVCTKAGVCKCLPGLKPPLCKSVCRPSCMNKGICFMRNRCHCRRGYFGRRCQYAVCRKVCLNGGVCYDNNKCNCKSGWTGDTCNVAICHPKCQNGGRCRFPNRCSCPNKTSGTYCQNVACTPRCLNGGQCLRRNICLCSHRYSGSRCETPVCQQGCRNGGTCVAPNQCVCPSGFFGNSCDRSSTKEDRIYSNYYKFNKMVSSIPKMGKTMQD
ncbi:uncharacterized protein LOC114535927 isoform X2 [Dendronephthya gigantea]|uniref:uncharacterized protein LOC114535927 isoform X2 n=1 Tax=Dendronephthya gigantea TaxID=151771 RepID=UPI001068F815|nr:uncharacterized protein LOC114535927 isoform X2 [Dendronephthya gigantea]